MTAATPRPSRATPSPASPAGPRRCSRAPCSTRAAAAQPARRSRRAASNAARTRRRRRPMPPIRCGRGCSLWSGRGEDPARHREGRGGDRLDLRALCARQRRLVRDGGARRRGDARPDRGARRSLSLAGRLRRGRDDARLCLCLRLPLQARLPLLGRDHGLCRRGRARARHRHRALRRLAASAGGAGLRPGDRRDHHPQ